MDVLYIYVAPLANFSYEENQIHRITRPCTQYVEINTLSTYLRLNEDHTIHEKVCSSCQEVCGCDTFLIFLKYLIIMARKKDKHSSS